MLNPEQSTRESEPVNQKAYAFQLYRSHWVYQEPAIAALPLGQVAELAEVGLGLRCSH